MAKSYLITLMLLAFPWTPTVTAQIAADPDLRIAIVPAKDERGRLTIHHDKHFDVHFTNTSDKPIRLWDQSCQPGHDTLNFLITDKNGNSWTMRRSGLAAGWEDCPVKTITLAAGATYVWRVVPLENRYLWSWTGGLEPNSGEDVTIAPVFEIKADGQTRKQGVWIGRIEGPGVAVRVVNPDLVTPHDYLWNQCPKQALKMLQDDPKWINQKDPEYRCTPLHHASRYGFVDVVEWLLANGADVDARAYNDFSPLYFADEPAVARAILRHTPKEKGLAVAFFRHPLEHAAGQVAWGGPPHRHVFGYHERQYRASQRTIESHAGPGQQQGSRLTTCVAPCDDSRPPGDRSIAAECRRRPKRS